MASTLLLAVRDPSYDVARLKLLLDDGADADADLEIVLEAAAERGPECLACVLSSRPNWPKARCQQSLRRFLKHSSTLLWTRRRTLEVFLEHGVDLVPEDAEDTELLFGAIKLDRYDLVEKLLAWGASVHEQFNGMNAIHVAANYANEGMIRLLVANGADVHARTSSGETPLSLAVSSGIPEWVKCLLTSGSEIPAIQRAGAWRYMERTLPGTLAVVRAVIEAGAHVNIPDGTGETLIKTASSFFRGEVMEELWKNGVRMNFDSDVVRRDFRHAISMNAMSTVKFYLKNGVELEGGMEEAIKLAVISSQQGMVHFFLEFDDPCSRTFECGDVLESTLCWRAIAKDVLEYGYTSLKPIFGVLEKIPSPGFSLFDDFNRGKVVTRHHVSLLMAAELSVNQHVRIPESLAKYLADSSSSPENFKHEVQSMKDSKIGDSDVTFYDVLNSPLSEVVRLLWNTSIVEVLKGGEFGADFPSYTGMITKRFRRALFRKTLEERGVKMLVPLCAHLPVPPREVREKIVDYLSNQNLYVLTHMYELPQDDIATTQSAE